MTYPISNIWLHFDNIIIIVGIGARDVITVIFMAWCGSHIDCFELRVVLAQQLNQHNECSWPINRIKTETVNRKRLTQKRVESKVKPSVGGCGLLLMFSLTG